MATPVINQPQVAILDTEAVVKRPVVVTDEHGDDSIAIRHDDVPVHVAGTTARSTARSPRSSSRRCVPSSRRLADHQTKMGRTPHVATRVRS